MKSERELIADLKEAKENKDRLEDALSEANKKVMRAESDLIAYMEARELKTIAVDGIGQATLAKPRISASCSEENRPVLFSYLRQEGRGDMIKEVVNPQSLSSFVKELLDEAKSIPEFVNYSLIQRISLTKK